MLNIFGLNLAQLVDVLAKDDLHLPKFRAKQIIEWLYLKHVNSFEEMTNLSKDLRKQLAEKFIINKASSCDQLNSKDGKTTKFLIQFDDGVGVETVLMRQPYGNSICVSSQAGCNMGCTFCASTLHGMARNLTTGEILAQAMFIQELLAKTGEQINNIVIMGSGEPMLNYDNVLNFIRLVHEPYCLNIGYRNIAISTSGIVPGMQKLAKEGLPITLSISLHAPNDKLRTALMPINKHYPLADVISAAQNYAKETKRRITYEYILIDKYNDNIEEAKQLCQLLKGQLANVNLIPINPVKERNFNRPSQARIKAFAKFLETHHISATVRQEMGTDINAACGQLRNKHLEK